MAQGGEVGVRSGRSIQNGQGGEVGVRSGRSIQNGTGRGGGSEEWEEHPEWHREGRWK